MKHASLKHFDASFSFEKSISILQHLSQQLLKPGHPFLELIERRDWVSLARASVDYESHLDQSTVRAERQVLAFFSKSEWLPLGIDRRKVALDKMIRAERDCAVTNWRIQNHGLENEVLDSGLIMSIQRKIGQILGPLPSLSELSPSFGPGINVGSSRLTSARHKMSVKPTYTTNAAPLIEEALAEFPHWDYLQQCEETNYGKLAFVPKDAKTDRTIETQPILNSFLQLGYGKWIKRRLFQYGCDLYKGQAMNAEYARRGSLHGSFSTIDLASASDTISSLLVFELLPPEWFSALDALRTPTLKSKDREWSLHRFSAMGNGYTFELESLIFYATCKVVCGDGEVLVYGDDIVVPTEHAARVMSVLQAMGFTVNTEKSYWQGRFRESCGKDFFDGVDVRPCYVKKAISVKEIYRLHNFFFRRGMAHLANECLRFIKKRWRAITGPDGFGDGHLLSLNPTMVPFKRDLGWAGWTFSTVRSKPKSVFGGRRGDYAAFLYYSQGRVQNEWEVKYRRPLVPSRMMYTERGHEGWSLKRIYTLGDCTFPSHPHG